VTTRAAGKRSDLWGEPFRLPAIATLPPSRFRRFGAPRRSSLESLVSGGGKGSRHIRSVPPLTGADVHVWLADVDTCGSEQNELWAALSSEERARADRFCFDRDRRRYAHSRGILRHLLAGYLGADPRELVFEAGSRGKPRLIDSPQAMAFNVSHSGSFALIAVSRLGEIGVDIEAHRPLDDRDDLAERFFSASESVQLRSLEPARRDGAFFTCWSRKEAYVKAVGDGLSYPLDAFDVTFSPGEAARLTVEGDADESRRWALEALPAPTGYSAALVTEGRRTVQCWSWRDANQRNDQYEEAI
jgi:4'-phosphopantetheinyl transferase